MEEPRPSFILRGHSKKVDTISFSKNNLYLLSCDESGFAFVWSLVTRRLILSFKAHDNYVLKATWYSKNKVITYAKGGELKIWELNLSIEDNINSINKNNEEQKKRFVLLYFLKVNNLSFCRFALYGCYIAMPNVDSSQMVDIIKLYKNEDGMKNKKIFKGIQTNIENPGLVMAVELANQKLISGYENGHVFVYEIDYDKLSCKLLHSVKAHNGPILYLALNLKDDTFITSSSDKKINKYSLCYDDTTKDRNIIIDTYIMRHAGSSCLSIRNDGKLLAISEWSGILYLLEYKTFAKLAEIESVSSENASGSASNSNCVDFGPIIPLKDVNENLISLNSESLNLSLKNDHNYDLAISLNRNRIKNTIKQHWLAIGGFSKISLYNLY